MSDPIERQDAIDAVEDWFFNSTDLRPPAEVLRYLPSAGPRNGQWCMTSDGKLVCSCCYEAPTNRIIVNGNLVYDMTPIRKRMKFCPNCGARMTNYNE